MFQSTSSTASATEASTTSGTPGKSTLTAGLPAGAGATAAMPAGVGPALAACVELTVADGHGWCFVLQPDFAFRIIGTPPGQEAKTKSPPIKPGHPDPRLASAWKFLADKIIKEHPAPAAAAGTAAAAPATSAAAPATSAAPGTAAAANDNAASPLDALLGGLSAVGDAITAYVDGVVAGITDGVGGLLEAVWPSAPAAPAAPAPAAPSTGGTPAVEPPAQGPGAAEPAPASGSPAFLDQRDNAFDKGGVSASNMCTVTSLAMNLIGLCGSADAVKQETAGLITAHGGTPPAADALAGMQTEDLLMTFFDELAAQGYWQTKAKETKPPFYGNWINDVPSGTKFHQAGACQAHVLAMYKGIASENLSRANAGCKTIQQFLTDHIKPLLDQGGTFAASTKLTGGHFVSFVAVLGDGIVIHDP